MDDQHFPDDLVPVLTKKLPQLLELIEKAIASG